MRNLSCAAMGILIIASSAAMAVAGEVSGGNIVVLKPTATTELPNGAVYSTTGNSQVCETSDPGHPLNDASGDCDGGCVSASGGAPSCMGSCTWVDTDGDLVFFTWAGGENEGTWELRGGSGKWADASGSGTWETTAVYVGNMARNSWSGTMEME